MLAYFQKGFNYGQDGPGNRLVIHMQGCNMSCPWCANPEGLSLSSKQPEGNRPNYQMVSTKQMVEEIISCQSLFFDGGGVTFTGGEATLQFEALKDVLEELKAKGIHTVIETNGTHPRLESLFPLVDLLIIDCKHVDSIIHEKVTGVFNKNILENIKKAAKAHPNVLVRIPLINGFNASEQDLKMFLEFTKEIQNLTTKENVKFEFLSYHEYGKAKWEASGQPYMVENGFVSKETLDAFQQAFRENGITLIHT